MNAIKKFLIRIIAGLMPTTDMRRAVRNSLTVGMGKTHRRGGKNNTIIYIAPNGKKRTVRKLAGCNIYFHGDNNCVQVHGPLNALKMDAKLYGNSTIIIQSSKYENRYLNIYGIVRNCNLEIGKDFYTNGPLQIEFTENSKIIIGNDCMFSYDIIMRTGDGHKIKSLDTGMILNENQDIIIGNHVWVACKAVLLKGAIVSDNSIVGACSLVNKKFHEENVILAGIPAQIKKHGINWER